MKNIDLSICSEFLRAKDLVDLGLFTSINQAYVYRAANRGPKWFKMGNKIMYRKSDLIEYVDSQIHNVEVDKQSPSQ